VLVSTANWYLVALVTALQDSGTLAVVIVTPSGDSDPGTPGGGGCGGGVLDGRGPVYVP
jgi:hypothetical protein